MQQRGLLSRARILLIAPVVAIGALVVPAGAAHAFDPPSPPTNLVATATDGQAVVTFDSSDGGFESWETYSAPDDTLAYKINVYVGGVLQTGVSAADYAAPGPTQSITVHGLTNGTTYTFKAVGRNGFYGNPMQESAESAASNAVTPTNTPGAPTGVTATAAAPGKKARSATISWNAPSFTGHSALSSYTVTASPGGATKTVSAPATSTTMTGLTAGTSYTFTVTATNAGGGTSAASTPSSSVTATQATGAPTDVSATPGAGQATVTFKAPGGGIESWESYSAPDDVLAYKVNAYVGGVLQTGISAGDFANVGENQSVTVHGLTNGTTYTFKVIARNGFYGTPVYESAESAASNAVTPTNTPGAPSGVSSVAAVPGAAARTVDVSWSAPSFTGYSALSSYTVTASPGGATKTVSAANTSTRMTGLTAGTSYTFTVTATNAGGGTSAPSAPSAAVTVSQAPGAPTNVSATAADGQATVTFKAPGGGFEDWESFTAPDDTFGYKVNVYVGGVLQTDVSGADYANVGENQSVTVYGLTNGTTYTFKVVARNGLWGYPLYESAESSASNAVTPTNTPGAPTGVSAVASAPGAPARSATVTWNAPSFTGHSALSSYTVTASPGGATKTVAAGTTSATVTGLTAGTSYTFTVTATNTGGGTSATSSASSAVTASSATGAPTNVSATAGDGQATVTFTAPGGGVASWDSYTPDDAISYEVKVYVDGVLQSELGTSDYAALGANQSLTVTGLTNGTTYTFKVLARNGAYGGSSINESDLSSASNAVTPHV